jgi:kynureninase
MSDVVVYEDTYTLVQQPDDASASQENALLDEWSEELQRALAANYYNRDSVAGLEHKLAELTISVRVETIVTVLCELVSM